MPSKDPAAHKEKAAARAKRNRERRKRDGRCTNHPKSPAYKNTTKCYECHWYLKKYRYGLDKETAERLARKQKGKCPVCRRPLDEDLLPMHTDHDHAYAEATGMVVIRAIVHPQCNTLIGQAETDATASRGALAYAARWARFRTSASVPEGVQTWIPVLDHTARPIEGETTST